jgi:hypothetical protein
VPFILLPLHLSLLSAPAGLPVVQATGGHTDDLIINLLPGSLVRNKERTFTNEPSIVVLLLLATHI